MVRSVIDGYNKCAGRGMSVPTGPLPSEGQSTMLEYTPKDIDRFWKFVDRTLPDDCWPWRGSCYPGGYGKFTFRHKKLSAHRVSYELTKGPIPDNMVICHTCDNPCCVNPSHLWAGTRRDNLRDMVEKGRNAITGAKLTPDDVRYIRELSNNGVTCATIATRYKMARSVISKIIRRTIWINVK